MGRPSERMGRKALSPLSRRIVALHGKRNTRCWRVKRIFVHISTAFRRPNPGSELSARMLEAIKAFLGIERGKRDEAYGTSHQW